MCSSIKIITANGRFWSLKWHRDISVTPTKTRGTNIINI